MVIFNPLSPDSQSRATALRPLVGLLTLVWLAPTVGCAGPAAERDRGADAPTAHQQTELEPSSASAPERRPSVERDPVEQAKRDEMADALAIIASPKELAERADEAKAKLQAIAKKDPKNVLALYNLGLIAWAQSDRAGAARVWRQALKVRPNYLPAKARLAQLKLVQGDKAGAVQELERIINKETGGDPYQAEARNILAEIAISEKRWEDARRHARNVLLGDADNMNAYLNLALTYFRHRLVDTALLIANTALKRRPDAAALHNLMGLIYLRKDNSRLAMDSFGKALAANPTLVDAKLNLAALELSYGDFQSALDRFDSVLANHPDDAEIVMSRAVALRGLERYKDAEAGYLKALAMNPKFSEAQYNLCVLHHQYTSDWKAALENCQAYAATLPKRGKKRRELNRRIRSIKSTIEALGPGDGSDDDSEGQEIEASDDGAQAEEPTDAQAAPTEDKTETSSEESEDDIPEDDGGQ